MSESFSDADTQDAWNRGADAWQEFVRSGADYYRTRIHGPALLQACTVAAGERALDAGCGEGYFTRELARLGARVSGIELSSQMLKHARVEERTTPLGIEYLEGSAGHLEQYFQPEQFQLIASCMAIQDMSDPSAFFRSAMTVLARNGRVVFSVPHPASDTPVRTWERDARGQKVSLKLDRYFDTGPAKCHWDMKRLAYAWITPYWRRTLEEWTSLAATAGFVIERLYEPKPDAESVARWPELNDCARMPYFLIFKLLKCTCAGR